MIVAYGQFGGLVFLWCAIRSAFKLGFEHVESKCGHVSMVLLGHSLQFGFGYKLGHKIFLRWLPIYWAYHNFRLCVVFGVCDPGVFPKLVGEFVVDLVIGCPFAYVCEFGLGQS